MKKKKTCNKTREKSVRFIHWNMLVGGAEKSLLRLLKNFDCKKYDTALTMHEASGELFSEIPEGVKVDIVPMESFSEDCARLPFGKMMKSFYYAFRCKRAKEDRFDWLMKIYDLCHHITADTVIVYAFVSPFCLQLGALSTAKRKALWIHGILAPDDVFLKVLPPFLDAFDTFFCVSEAVRAWFNELYPEQASKTVVMYNLTDTEKIRMLADEEALPKEKDVSVLCTVTRIVRDKGTELIPEIARRLTEDGYNIRWYLVGDGYMREYIEQIAGQLGVADKIIFCGTKINPYPYVKACDVYVQPTFSEGFCLSVNEAKILCRPIVVTDIPCMYEQLEPNKNALFAEWSIDAFVEKTEKLLDSPELREQFTEDLKNAVYDNQRELDKLYSFIDG